MADAPEDGQRILDLIQEVSRGWDDLHTDTIHADQPFTDEDQKMGSSLAYFIGSLFPDIGMDPEYFTTRMTPKDEWTRVARALRVYRMKISPIT